MINNCTAHPKVENLVLIELIFLPLNTTSHAQPMDQVMIEAFNIKYRSLAVFKLILAFEKKEPMQTISILSAMIMLTKSWHVLSNKFFTSCFKIVGI